MTRWKIILPVLLLLLGVGAVKVLSGGARGTAKAVKKERVLPVQTISVRRAAVPFSIRGEGVVRAAQTTALSAQVSGRVVALSAAAKTGGRFARGAVILRLDGRDYRARAVQAQAAVQRAQLELELAQQRRVVARAELRGSGVAKVDEAHPLAQHTPQLRAATAALRSAEAGRELARLAVERTELRAPYDCVVRRRSVEVGDVVAPGRQLLSIAGTAVYEVSVTLSQDRLAKLQLGGELTRRKAEISLMVAGARRIWVAKLDRVEAEVEPLGRLARVVLRIEEPLSGAHQLLLGSFVSVQIAGTPFAAAVRLPERALRGESVLIVNADSRLENRPVTIAHRSPGFAVISAGLNDGDEVVISRLRNPIPGTKVRLLGDADPAATPAKDALR